MSLPNIQWSGPGLALLREERESLAPGDAAKLLFDIETREAGQVIDRGVERMWVIVKRRVANNYTAAPNSLTIAKPSPTSRRSFGTR